MDDDILGSRDELTFGEFSTEPDPGSGFADDEVLATREEILPFARTPRPRIDEPTEPEPGFFSDVGDAFTAGLDKTLTFMQGVGVLSGAVSPEYYVDEWRKAMSHGTPEDLQRLYSDLDAASSRMADTGFWGDLANIGDMIWSTATNPKGAALAIVEQIPNIVPSAVGAGAGFLTPVPGGAIIGMSAGTMAVETGAKLFELLAEKVPDGNRERALEYLRSEEFIADATQQGLTKGAIIATIDAITLKVAGRLFTRPGRDLAQAQKAISKKYGLASLDDAGTLATDQLRSLQSELAPHVERYLRRTRFASRAGQTAGALTLESGGESLGEGVGEYAASGRVQPDEIFLEGVASLGMSTAQTSMNAIIARQENKAIDTDAGFKVDGEPITGADAPRAAPGAAAAPAEGPMDRPPEDIVNDVVDQFSDALDAQANGRFNPDAPGDALDDLARGTALPPTPTADQILPEITREVSRGTSRDQLARIVGEDRIAQMEALGYGERDFADMAQGTRAEGVDPELGQGLAIDFMDRAIAAKAGPDRAAEILQQQRSEGLRPMDMERPEDLLMPPSVDAQANQAATSPENDLPEPTWAQIDANNWKQGTIEGAVEGVTIKVENPIGSIRRSRPEAPQQWERTMERAHYGRIRNTVAADGEPADVFVTRDGADPSRSVYLIDQVDENGNYDEVKVILGAESEADARAIYLANYPSGWNGLGAITTMSRDEFQDWVKNGDQALPLSPEIRQRAKAQQAAAPEAPERAPEQPAPRREAPAARPTAEAAQRPETASAISTGRRDTVYTDRDQFDVEYRVVEMSDLVPSNNPDGTINPDYPADRQPRERTRADSLMQVRHIANTLIPERLLESVEADRGAPIVDTGLIVESGNGRIMSLQLAPPEKRAAYRQAVAQWAERNGVDRADVDAMEFPVLVRVRGDADMGRIIEMTRDANQSAGLRLSPSEQAKIDADRLTQDDMRMFAPDESGNVLAASNRPFLSRFAERIGANEAANLRTADGAWGKEMADRVSAAVFQRAYNNDRLLKIHTEEANTDIRNILYAMQAAAPSFVVARGMEANTEIIDTVGPIVEAIEFIQKAKQTNQSIHDALAQLDIMSRLSPSVELIVGILDQNKRAPRRLAEFFKAIGEETVAEIVGRQTADMFGGREVSADEAIQNAAERQEPPAQAEVFDTAGRDQGRRPGEPAGRGRTQDGDTSEVREPVSGGAVYGTARPIPGSVAEDDTGQIDIFSTSGRAPGADQILSRVRNVEVGRFTHSVETVNTPEDAMRIIAPIGRKAQENMVALVLDADNRPLQVIRHSIGTSYTASVEVGILLGAVHSVDGARSAWFAHNHPSGSADPSSADINVTRQLTQNLARTGVESRGMLIIGSKGRWTHFESASMGDFSGGERMSAVQDFPEGQAALGEVQETGGERSTAVTEREIVNPETGKWTISSAAGAKAVASNYEGDGVILLDNRQNVVGWVSIPLAEMNRLRETGIAARLYRAISSGNARTAIIKTEASLEDSRAPVQNMMRFLEQSGVPAVDALWADSTNTYGYESYAESGQSLAPSLEPFFARSDLEDYRGTHQAPDRQEGASLDDVSAIYPDDVYSADGARLYGSFIEGVNDQKVVEIMRRVRGRPDAQVTVYRAVPDSLNPADKIARLERQRAEILRRGRMPSNPDRDVLAAAEAMDMRLSSAYYEAAGNAIEMLSGQEATPAKINPGDWVTLNRSYAVLHGRANLDGNYKIISRKVRAGDLFTEGNSLQEWGWAPEESASIIETPLRRFAQEVKDRHGLKAFDLSERNDTITLHMIEVQKGERRSGKGSAAMRELVEYADKNNKRIYLSPGLKDDIHGTTSRARLVRFYKRFGFVENKGRNKDFTFQGGMYRNPRGDVRFARAPRRGIGYTSREALISDLRAKFGKVIDRMVESGQLVILDTNEDAFRHIDREYPGAFTRGSLGTVFGYYDKADTVRLVAENLDTDTTSARGAVRVMLHEAGIHYGADRVYGAETKAAMIRRAKALRDAGERRASMNLPRDQWTDADWVYDAARRIPETTKPEHYDEEILAYVVNFAPESSLGKRIIARIKAFLLRLGVPSRLLTEFTVADFAEIARGAVRHMPGKEMSIYGGRDYSDGPAYMVGYHGTPTRWAPEPGFPHGRPRLDKIGTGEGAQAYGYGFYSADADAVGANYAVAPTAELDRINARLTELARTMERYETSYRKFSDPRGDAAAREYDRLMDERANLKGTLYTLDIPDADLAKYLDWDAPLSEQPEAVRAAVAKASISRDSTYGGEYNAASWPEGMTGGDWYAKVSNALGGAGQDHASTQMGRGDAQKAASEFLRDLGIPGLKYLDQGSRDAGDGTRNYVTWDQDVLDRSRVVAINGEPVDDVPQFARTALPQAGRPYTSFYVHNTESATRIFGKPTPESPYERGFEPSGKYVTVLDRMPTQRLPNMEYGQLRLENPLVVEQDSEGRWKRALSERYDGKTGKALSKAIIADGHDGVVTIAQSRSQGAYVSEVVDLTNFDEDIAMFARTTRRPRARGQFTAVPGQVPPQTPAPMRHQINKYNVARSRPARIENAWARSVGLPLLNWVEDRLGVRRGQALGTLPDQVSYLQPRYLAKGAIRKWENIASEMNKALNSKTAKRYHREIMQYLTAGAPASVIPDADARAAAVKARALITQVGEDLVAMGILPRSVYEANKADYLPRVYMKYILGPDAWKKLMGGRGAKGMTLDLGYTKKRNEQLSEEYRNIILGQVHNPGYLVARALTIPTRDIALMEFLNTVSQKSDWVIPESMVRVVSEYDADGNPRLKEWTPGATDDTDILNARPKGRAVTANYLANEAKRLRHQADRMADATYQKQARLLAEDMDNLARAMERRLEAVTGAGEISLDDMVKLPDTARYGALRGMYVRKEISADIRGSYGPTGEQAGIAERILGTGGFVTKYIGLWKGMKVAMNYPTQFRNFVSNAVLLHISGVPFHMVPVRMTQALREIAKNGHYWQIAKKWGVQDTTFTAAELHRIETDMIKEREKGGVLASIKIMAAHVYNAHGDLYGLSESLFKTAKIIDELKRGATEEEAAIAGHQSVFDYSLIPPSVKYLRNSPIGAPFLTFYFKALGAVTEAALLRPWVFLPYVAIPYAITKTIALLYDVDDDDVDKLKESLPDWLRERGGTAILPARDEHGRWQAVSYGYFLPWQMQFDLLSDFSRGDMREGMQTLGLFGGPVIDLVAAIKTGVDPFSRMKITNDAYPPSRQMADWMYYLYQLNAPTVWTHYGMPYKLWNAANGRVDTRKLSVGEPLETVPQAMARFFGVNIYPIDPTITRARNIINMRNEMNVLRSDAAKRIRQAALNGDQDAVRIITSDLQDEMRVRALQLQEYIQGSEVHPNLERRR